MCEKIIETVTLAYSQEVEKDKKLVNTPASAFASSKKGTESGYLTNGLCLLGIFLKTCVNSIPLVQLLNYLVDATLKAVQSLQEKLQV